MIGFPVDKNECLLFEKYLNYRQVWVKDVAPLVLDVEEEDEDNGHVHGDYGEHHQHPTVQRHHGNPTQSFRLGNQVWKLKFLSFKLLLILGDLTICNLEALSKELVVSSQTCEGWQTPSIRIHSPQDCTYDNYSHCLFRQIRHRLKKWTKYNSTSYFLISTPLV